MYAPMAIMKETYRDLGKETEKGLQISPPSSQNSDTQPKTQPMHQPDHAKASEAPKREPWGYLIGKSFKLPDIFPLVADECNVGRHGKSCCLTLSLTEHALPEKIFMQISNVHFKIYKLNGMVFLLDLSSNGTFVNGKQVGGSEPVKGKIRKVVLQPYDKISLLSLDGPTFAFQMDMKVNDNEKDMPDEILQKFRVVSVLGSGASGSVHLAMAIDSCKPFALKKIDKNYVNLGMNSIPFIENEIKILKAISHINIVKVHDIIDLEKQTFIVMEYMEGGTLACRMRKNNFKPLREDYCKLYFYQLLLALNYLNSQSIIHRDIKPENILLSWKTDPSLVKLADFGLSRFVSQSRKAVTCCGSYEYVAPEVIKGNKQTYTSKVDIWSLGVTLFFCLSGKLPFFAKDAAKLKEFILSGRYSMQNQQWAKVSPEAKEIVRSMLEVNPDERLNAVQLLDCAWFKGEAFIATVKDVLPPPIYESPVAAKKMRFDEGAHCSKSQSN